MYHLCVQRESVIDGDVGGDDQVVGGHAEAIITDNGSRVLSSGDLFGVCVREDLSTVFRDRFGQTEDVLENIELSLVWDLDACTRLGKRQWCFRTESRASRSCFLDGLELLLDLVHSVFLLGGFKVGDDITVDSIEVAFNALFFDDLLDLVYGGGVALYGKASGCLVVLLNDIINSIVLIAENMAGRATGFTASEFAVFDQYNLLSLLGKQIRGRKTSDSSSNDHHIGLFVLGKLWKARNVGLGIVPNWTSQG